MEPLFVSHPALCREWDAEKNTVTPQDVTAGSHKQVWWRCGNGHAWQSAPYSRVSGSGCPYCSGRRTVPGETDLASTHPALCREWDAEKNTVTPRDVTAGSHKQVWWRCSLGHSYTAAPYSRAYNGSSCPYCTNRRVLPGFNDLAKTHPRLCGEWDVGRNGDLTPETVTHGSTKKVWWRCADGHVWQAAVYSRTRQKPAGCPVCGGHTRRRCISALE